MKLPKGSKFKDATSLLASYNALQAEFTKKCQELAKYKNTSKRVVKEQSGAPRSLTDTIAQSFDKKNQELGAEECSGVGQKTDEIKTQDVDLGEEVLLCEKVDSDPKVSNETDEKLNNGLQNIQQNVEKGVENPSKIDVLPKITQNQPIFASSSWREKVADFFIKNPKAKDFSKDISKLLMSDKGISGLDNCLEVAYSLVSSAKEKPASLGDIGQSILNDNEFVEENIVANPKIRNKVIASYLSEIKSGNKNVPTYASSKKSGHMPITPAVKVRTLEDARRHLLTILQSGK